MDVKDRHSGVKSTFYLPTDATAVFASSSQIVAIEPVWDTCVKWSLGELVHQVGLILRSRFPWNQGSNYTMLQSTLPVSHRLKPILVALFRSTMLCYWFSVYQNGNQHVKSVIIVPKLSPIHFVSSIDTIINIALIFYSPFYYRT